VGEVTADIECLEQPLEGHVLVRQGVHGHGPDPCQQLAKAGVARVVHPQGQGVEERPDQGLGLFTRPVRHRGSHDDVGLAAEPTQQGLKCPQEHHEQGDALALPQLAEAGGHGFSELERLATATDRLRRIGIVIRRQLEQGRGVRELTAPVVDGRLEAGLRPLTLAARMGAVLHGQGGERRGAAARVRRIERAQLAGQDTHRPPVGHDVVGAQQEDVVALPQAKAGGS
jgi:hypothetical protein